MFSHAGTDAPDGGSKTRITLDPGGDWENIDWGFSDMLCGETEDWSLGGLL